MRVPLYEGAENKPYYKFLMDLDPLPQDLLDYIKNCKGKPEDALNIEDRAKMQEPERLPAKTGFYYLKQGGLHVASNVPVPDITPEMLIWFSSIYPFDPLIYAIWEPEDHYDAQPDEVAVQRLFDDSIPPVQKLWGGTHTGTEAMGGPPGPGKLSFLDPGTVGFNRDIIGTEKCPYLYCANTEFVMGPVKVPIFLLETIRYDENGSAELRFRAWIGYKVNGNEAKCVLPKFIKIPSAAPIGLIEHNFKEFGHLNKVLPKMYAERDMIEAEIRKMWRK